jgi:hypothetical protein
VRTLLGFGGRLGVVNALLQLFLKSFLKKLSSFDEKEVFHVVEGLTEGGVIGDEAAVIEKGIEFGVKPFTTAGGKKGDSGA